MIKIMIADDHAIVREGLKQIIADTPDMAVCGEAGNGHEVIEKAVQNHYDVIVLDITMPGSNIMDVLKQLKAHTPETSVLVLTMHPEQQYAIRVLKAGAFGYLTKESAPEELVKAIRKVSAKHRYISPALAETLAADLGISHETPPHERLSDREFQVMCEIAAGKAVKEIAEALFLSDKTVSTYRSRILQKMKLKNNADLIRYAIIHELVD